MAAIAAGAIVFILVAMALLMGFLQVAAGEQRFPIPRTCSRMPRLETSIDPRSMPSTPAARPRTAGRAPFARRNRSRRPAARYAGGRRQGRPGLRSAGRRERRAMRALFPISQAAQGHACSPPLRSEGGEPSEAWWRGRSRRCATKFETVIAATPPSPCCACPPPASQGERDGWTSVARLSSPFLLVAACLISNSTVHAEISPQALAQVGVHATAGAHAPLDASFVDQDGRPTSLRSVIAGRTSRRLAVRGLPLHHPVRPGPGHRRPCPASQRPCKPGRDVALVTVGLNPRETPADARALRDARLQDEPRWRAAAHLLTGGQAQITEAQRTRWATATPTIPQSGQYTHPVAAFVLTA